MKINTFFSRKKTYVVFLLVFLFQILFISMGPATAYAADVNKAQNEYTSYQAFRLMAYDCIWADNDTNGTIYTDPKTWMPFSSFFARTNDNMAVGSGFYGNNSGQVRCDDTTWINKALEIWGYSTPKAFLDDLAKTGNGKGIVLIKEGDKKGAYEKIGSGRSDELTQVIIQTLKNKKIDVGGLTPAIQYYAWLQNFTNQCSGTFSLTDPGNSGDGKKSLETKYWANDKGEVVKGWLVYNPNYKTGSATDYNPIAVGTSIKNDGRDSCETIAQNVASGINNGEGAKAYAVYVKEGNTQPITPPDGTAGKDSSFSACSSQLRPFGWVLCPVLNIASSMYETFVGLVNSILFFSTEKYAESGLYKSWAIFVRLANAVLVLVGLIMLAGQIFSFEVFSAYTVKKVLPRLVIGAILIQLSWFIFTIMAQIVNALGSGVYWLLLSPFGFDTSGGMVTFFEAVSKGEGSLESVVASAFGGGAVVVGAAAATAIVVGSGAWISVIVAFMGVLISIIVALVTLMLRESLLIICLAISPIAIAAWILPSTNNLWNLWWKTYSRLLMMYPLIMLLFAGGTIAAHVLSQADKAGSMALSTLTGLKFFSASPQGNNSYLFLLLEIIAFFAPIFMISMTFKFAGQAFGSISNITGKIGNKMQGSAGKMGESGSKKYKGWAAGKYEHGAKGPSGRMKNIWARSASGNYLPTRGGAARTAAAGLAYAQERSKETETLVASALHGKTYDQQGKMLVELMRSDDAKVADAARLRATSTGRIDLVEQSMYKARLDASGKAVKDAQGKQLYDIDEKAMQGHWSLMNSNSDYGKAVAQQRTDLAINPADFKDSTDDNGTTITAHQSYTNALQKAVSKKSAEDILSSHDSYFSDEYASVRMGGVDSRVFIDDTVIDTLATNPNYSARLQIKGREYVASRSSGSSSGGSSPNPTAPPQTGPTIITPGSSDSNIPPGSRPGGPNFNP